MLAALLFIEASVDSPKVDQFIYKVPIRGTVVKKTARQRVFIPLLLPASYIGTAQDGFASERLFFQSLPHPETIAVKAAVICRCRPLFSCTKTV